MASGGLIGNFEAILRFAMSQAISDVHLKSGKPPVFRVAGELVVRQGLPVLPPTFLEQLAETLLSDYHKKRLDSECEADFAHGIEGLGRFRINVFRQRGKLGFVCRAIPSQVQNMSSLHLPPVLQKVSLEERGLVLVTGVTGSGKSTTLASMIDHVNRNRACHILTIEDPIEFMFQDERSHINQREVGIDTRSFANALRAALRQDPDVILIGEMRDVETIETAMHAAETGHLVFSTLHTLNAPETVNRIVSTFPPHQQRQVRMQLSTVLKAVVSQRLVRTVDGKGRVPAVEVMVVNAKISELVSEEGGHRAMPEQIAKGYRTYGMQTFDQSLMYLFKNNHISYEEALKQCSNPSDFALRVSGIAGGGEEAIWADFMPADKKK